MSAIEDAYRYLKAGDVASAEEILEQAILIDLRTANQRRVPKALRIDRAKFAQVIAEYKRDNGLWTTADVARSLQLPYASVLDYLLRTPEGYANSTWGLHLVSQLGPDILASSSIKSFPKAV